MQLSYKVSANVKVKFSLEQTTTVQKWSIGIAILLL
jgi:hypothetical protein